MPMRSKAAAGLVGAVAVAVVTAAPTRARADSTSLHVLGDLETGWTDNIFSAPSDTTVGAPAREGDAYAQLRPGLLFTWERPRMIQQLEAAIEAFREWIGGETLTVEWQPAGTEPLTATEVDGHELAFRIASV